MQTATDTKTDLVEKFLGVRAYTEALAEPLSPEDQCIQSMQDVSPTKWHRAHTSWFFETFILGPHKEGYEVFDMDYCYLFNSYYENVGARHSRPDRGLITRPSSDEIAEYRKFIDAEMQDFLSKEVSEEITSLIILGINHEQQHQELILSDIKDALFANPKLPIYLEDFPLRKTNYEEYINQNDQWQSFTPESANGGRALIGHKNDGFSFDNETPAHEVLLQDFELSKGLVSVGDWLEFMADGGYETPTLWLSDGWSVVQEQGWKSPKYFFQMDGDWKEFTLSGVKPLEANNPVMHISYYEADAFARWADARLPTEFEWEYSVSSQDINMVEQSPVWQWTSTPYCPYPGFVPAKGAVGEYNGKFMVNQMVLRGSCWATPANHSRYTYRNFYGPKTRWHFSGLKLAKGK